MKQGVSSTKPGTGVRTVYARLEQRDCGFVLLTHPPKIVMPPLCLKEIVPHKVVVLRQTP